ncbi:GPW/gp25 family protein [Sorangium sp. So ce260]|uniref:GPW/gp25 family protein n=1 Tax=Sorangium sp. So ce260 TaxID=3133291 RepID=UPI003F5FBBFD
MHVEFPFRVQSGTVDVANDEEWVVGLIEQVLFTMPGERVNLPTFGCGVEQLVFQQNSAQMATAVQYMVKSELQRWLSGIADIKSVVVTDNQDVLAVTIDYVNLVTGATSQVTLPRSP